MKKLKLALSILDVPGPLASWLGKHKDAEIHDSGKEYKITGLRDINPQDLSSLTLLGLVSIHWDRKSLVIFLKK